MCLSCILHFAELTYMLKVFLIPQDFPHRKLCHLKIGAVLFFPFERVCLLFPYLALLHGLELPTLFNKNGKSGDPCFVPNLRRKVYSILLLNKMLSVGALNEVEEVLLYSYFSGSF